MATSDPRKPLMVTPSQSRRLSDAVRRSEGAYSPNQRTGRVNTFNPGVMWAKCTEVIPAGSWDVPTAGEVQIYHMDATGSVFAESGDPVPCHNIFDFGDDVAVGDVCLVAWIDGKIWYVNSNCGA